MNNPDQNKLVEAMKEHADRIAFEAKNGIALAQKLVDFYVQWYSHPGDPTSFRLVRETFRQWQASSQPAPVRLGNPMMHIASLVVGVIVALATLARLFEKRYLRFVIHHHLRAKRKWDLLPWECERGHRSEFSGTCRQKVRLSDYTGPYTIRCAQMLRLRPEKALALADEGFGAGTIGT